MNRPASIRDIARAAGCGKSTVAKALANLPGVAAGTRARIQRAARSLGYRRDPVVADLAARRWRSRPGSAPLTLAYVHDFTGTRLRIPHPHFEAARIAAAEHGYRLEPFDLSGYEPRSRATRVLESRGYRGLLVGRIMRQDMPLDLEWSRFTAVACARGVIWPPLHIVEADYFEAARLVCATAIERGYRRPGYVHCINYAKEGEDPERIGGYMFARRILPRGDQIPVCVVEFERPERAVAWYRRWRPDTVIGFNDSVYWWLHDAGIRAPEDVGYATLSCDRTARPITTGTVCMDAEVGVAALELLVGQIHINARGLPKPVRSVYVEPEWREGRTLPDRLVRGARPPRQGR